MENLKLTILLNELKSTPYLNALLDKISEKGMNSLTPEEMEDLRRASRGESIRQKVEDKPELNNEPEFESDWEDDSDFDYITDFTPRKGFLAMAYDTKVFVNDEVWETYVDSSHDGLGVTNEETGIIFYVFPFLNGATITVMLEDGRKSDLPIPDMYYPKNMEDMDEFFQFFYDKLLVGIIKQVKNTLST